MLQLCTEEHVYFFDNHYVLTDSCTSGRIKRRNSKNLHIINTNSKMRAVLPTGRIKCKGWGNWENLFSGGSKGKSCSVALRPFCCVVNCIFFYDTINYYKHALL